MVDRAGQGSMTSRKAFLFSIYAACYLGAATVDGLGEIFCGKENCYSMLGVEPNATARQIQKAYRNISLTLHPDKNPSPTAGDEFRRIANAYEILNDNATRADYDYALAHPEEHMLNQYRYYRNRVYRQMKVPWQITLTGVVLLCSVIHYITKQQMYENAMKHIRRSPKYRSRLKEVLAGQQSLPAKPLAKGSKQGSRARKLNELDGEELAELERQVDSECIVQGGRQKPQLTDILAYQLLLLPIKLFQLVKWELQWVWAYYILKRPYDQDAVGYLTRHHMRLTPDGWGALSQQAREEAVARKLWIPENHRAYVEEQLKLEELKGRRYASRRR